MPKKEEVEGGNPETPKQKEKPSKELLERRKNDAKIIAGNIDRTDRWLEAADENGLFLNDSEGHKNIVETLCAARKDLDQDIPNNVAAHEKSCAALHALNQAINDPKNRRWRFTYAYGGPAILYLLAVLLSLLLAWVFFSDAIIDSEIFWLPSWAFVWGSIGSVLAGFWWLWQNVSDRYFRKHWYSYFCILPMIGAILGALAYLVFFAGFVATTGETVLKSEAFVMLLCGLAGFSSRWAVEMLEKVMKTIKIG